MGALSERTRLLPLCPGYLQVAFPLLPKREQFNRLQWGYSDAIAAFSLCLV
jgi:hypothetical protein